MGVDMLSMSELYLLKTLYAKLGRRTKTLIRRAWETGVYDSDLLLTPNAQQVLQSLRNRLGPKWLVNVHLSQLVE